MSEGFFQRWARRKSEARDSEQQVRTPPAYPEADDGFPNEERQDFTLADVARMDSDADITAFLAPHVDRLVQRAALKKLFADPHFNKMDGLDVYIGDYTRAEPIPPSMRAALQHVRGMLENTDEATERSEDSRDPAGEPERKQALARHAPSDSVQPISPDPTDSSST